MSEAHFEDSLQENYKYDFKDIQDRKEEIYEEKKIDFFDTSKFKNSDDIVGVSNFVKLQKEESERLKKLLRIENEKYLRNHNEIEVLINVFMCKILEEKPDNIWEFAGKFFSKYIN